MFRGLLMGPITLRRRRVHEFLDGDSPLHHTSNEARKNGDWISHNFCRALQTILALVLSEEVSATRMQ